MGTIPPIPVVTAGAYGASADFNNLGKAVKFWASVPRCYAYGATSTTLGTSGTVYPIALDGTVYDIANSYNGTSDAPHHDNATDNSRITCRTTGKYEITAQATFVNNSTGVRFASIRLNAAGNPAGGSLLAQTTQTAVSGGFATALAFATFEVQLNAGDYIELFGQQTSGGSLGTSVGQGVTFLRMKLAGS
jgi:predicted heme/steroid binding protein